VFKLYDTFGVPADLTELIAKERGWMTDNAGFVRIMEEQRVRTGTVEHAFILTRD